MKTNTNTLTKAILAVVKSNSRRGVTVPEIVQKLERKFPNGLDGNTFFGSGFDRQTVSGRVTALYNNFSLEKSYDTRLNPATGRQLAVYVP